MSFFLMRGEYSSRNGSECQSITTVEVESRLTTTTTCDDRVLSPLWNVRWEKLYLALGGNESNRISPD